MRRAGLGAACALGIMLVMSDPRSAAARQDSVKPTSGPSGSSIVKAKIDDFGWLFGRWTAELAKNKAEETWAPPMGGSMIGMYRMVSPEKGTTLIEIETLREIGETVELRFRHMNADLVAWEAIDDPIVMRLVKLTADEVIWETPTPDKPRKGYPTRQVWKRTGDKEFAFEVYAPRDGGEKKIIEGRMNRAN